MLHPLSLTQVNREYGLVDPADRCTDTLTGALASLTIWTMKRTKFLCMVTMETLKKENGMMKEGVQSWMALSVHTISTEKLICLIFLLCF